MTTILIFSISFGLFGYSFGSHQERENCKNRPTFTQGFFEGWQHCEDYRQEQEKCEKKKKQNQNQK